ncbi:MAG TPA: response regulator [Steroidobacteraceae bacterium]|nr:response regulator [Steroidobacteraceae bacterium]
MNSDSKIVSLNRSPAEPGVRDRAGKTPSPEKVPPIQILIVDDEPKNLVVLETVLEDPDYRLVRAHSADEALLALVAEQFALLILDIRMPGMTGFELAEVIKKRKKTAQVPIIFLTAYYSEDQHVLEGYGSGAVDYLHKPVNPQILRSKVAVFAELHRKSRDVALANGALLQEVKERRKAEEQLRQLNETLEQRVAERTEELHQANRMKDEFLAMLGHELRNPLAAIMNAVQVMHVSAADPNRIAKSVGLVDRQTRSLRRIVDDLLDVARVTRGKIELRREPADVGQIVLQAIDVVRPHLSKAEDVEVALPPGPTLRIDADRTRLEQSIVNLLLNAIKFTQGNRRIKVLVEAQERDVVISIIDNGIGIPPEMLAKIFDLFTQADKTLDRSQGGLGIGLFICKRLVELHGGTISAFSEGAGCGSMFKIRLPLLHEAALELPLPVSRAAAAPAVSSTASAKRVLIVDDNVDSAITLSWLLGQHGYVVEVAHDGTSGLKAAQEFRPDIFLLDIGLPGINGYELARRLRAEGFASAHLVAISGYAHEADMERSRTAGFDRHFAKPVDLDELVRSLSER